MIPGVAVMVRSDPNIDWSGAFRVDLSTERVRVVSANRLVPALHALPPILSPNRVMGLAVYARLCFRAAA
jgi:hypothetical protein